MLDWLAEPGALWLFAAAMLAGIELAVPGVFLVFLAVAAAITGVFTLLFPDLDLAAAGGLGTAPAEARAFADQAGA